MEATVGSVPSCIINSGPLGFNTGFSSLRRTQSGGSKRRRGCSLTGAGGEIRKGKTVREPLPKFSIKICSSEEPGKQPSP